MGRVSLLSQIYCYGRVYGPHTWVLTSTGTILSAKVTEMGRILTSNGMNLLLRSSIWATCLLLLARHGNGQGLSTGTNLLLNRVAQRAIRLYPLAYVGRSPANKVEETGHVSISGQIMWTLFVLDGFKATHAKLTLII